MRKLTSTPNRPKPWRDSRIRAVVLQILTAVLIVWAGYVLFSNTMAAMASRGIATGFGFLDDRAGFGILFSLIPYDETMSYGRTFVVGLLNTVLVSAMGVVVMTVFGFMMGIARLSTNWLLNRTAATYIEVFRNVPVLLQIYFWYRVGMGFLPPPRQSLSIGGTVFLNKRGLYFPSPHFQPAFWLVVLAFALGLAAAVWLVRRTRAIQDETGMRKPVLPWVLILTVGLPVALYGALGDPISWSRPGLKGFNLQGGVWIIPELAALTFALSFHHATYVAELVRAGIQSVSSGQTEAAMALGLRPGRTLRLIVIPQAMRVTIPPLISECANLAKNSSLATAIGFPDLVNVFMGTALNQSGRAVEIVAMTMAVYLTISLSISAFMNWWNRRMTLLTH